MKSARRSLAIVLLLIAAASARADLALFPAVDTGPYLECVGRHGIAVVPGEGEDAKSIAAVTYSLLLQHSLTDATLAIGVGGAANVTNFKPLAGAAVDLDDAYDPPRESVPDSLVMAGPRLLGGAAILNDGGIDYVVADFEFPWTTLILVGDDPDYLSLHYFNSSFDAGDGRVRIWGAVGGSVGRMQFFFDLDQDGAVPNEPAAATGMVLDAGRQMRFDGNVMLGNYKDGGEDTPWVFDANLFASDFGAYVDGRIGGWTSTVPEPATLTMMGLGIAGLAALRRRRR